MMRSRPFRAVCAAGAVVCGVLAVLSTSAYAAGEFTTATLVSPTEGEGSSASFTWDYEFHQNGGHGLSNLAVGFCDEDVLDHIQSASQSYTLLTDGQGGHDGFDGIKLDVTEVTGTFSVTFDQEYDIDPEGLLLQSHSGDGDQGDIVRTAPGPGPCPETTSSSTEDTVVVNNNPTTTTAAPTTTTTAAPAIQAVVLGETLTAPVQAAELPRTGSNGLLTLTLAGLSLILAGLACGRIPRPSRTG